MNLYGSYKALLGNSVSAMLAAIEIYNKPQFQYRAECFVILLLNSWELAFKAHLSLNKIRIFKAKERGKPYHTLGLWDAVSQAKSVFPTNLEYRPVVENINLLADYRNNAVHFYNQKDFEIVIYGLAQTSIVNYRDFIQSAFDRDITEEVNISLLPLSFGVAPDPIQFLGTHSDHHAKPAIAEFLKVISDTTSSLEEDGLDTARFLTVFQVSLQSTKKIESADLVVGVQTEAPENGLLLVNRKVDPNISHPHSQATILEQIGRDVNGIEFNSRTFQALVWRYDLKSDDSLCWKNVRSKTFQYSNQVVTQMRSYSADHIQEARNQYSTHMKQRRIRQD